LFLGQIPNPQSGQTEVNLELARMFIDQLAMVQEKTRGNLSSEEAAVLRNTLSNLQMAFVEASQNGRAAGAAESPRPEAAPEPSAQQEAGASPPPPVSGGEESRKKFTKSYGAS
jgi:hypothetical protein